MGNEHTYSLRIQWTGNTGMGTAGYHGYERNYSILIGGKPEIKASSDPAFLGDKTRHNPEELLLASLSGCHMLWFLHLCADKGIIVTDYTDNATGTMVLAKNGCGKFSEVVLNPVVTIRGKSSFEILNDLHSQANKMCFIANSVNFPVRHKGTLKSEEF
jgi:organic hydroperoxide reductase OsmC/OhrA